MYSHFISSFFFLNDPAPTEFSPLPLPAALPIWEADHCRKWRRQKRPRQKSPRPAATLQPRGRSRGAEESRRGATREIEGDAGVACEDRSEEHTSELQSQSNLVCRLLLEKKKKQQ